ncbi:MAG: TRAP transporter large permease [Desulfitobacteriaceae bacterium]
MEWWLMLLIIFGSFLVLLAVGFPVAFAFMLINLVSAFALWGGDVGHLVMSIYKSVTSFTLLPVPMFVLMGEVMFQSGIAPKMMEVLDKWLGRLPGRLSLLAVGSGVIFATMTGSSTAGVAMLGSLLVPNMVKRGYNKKMTVGPILASGGLAMMIPPTALGVLLASMAYISVGKFLIAIIVPGLLMAAIYAAYLITIAIRDPSSAPMYEPEPMPLSEKLFLSLKYIIPLVVIIFLVIGLMMIGVATPTEAAALGTLGCFVLAFLYGGLKWRVVKDSLLGTLRITFMIFMILAASTAFAEILAYTGATKGLVATVAGMDLSPFMIVIAMQVVYFILGCFMEPLSILMLTMPIFMPIVDVAGINKLWFAVLVLINVETAVITPPFGTSLFVMKGVAPVGTTIGEIYRSSIPYVALNVLTMALVMIFPSLVSWLPGLIS